MTTQQTAPAGAHLPMLVRYKAWADALLYASLATLPAPELAAPRPLFTGNILRMLNHVYLMDVVWKSHLLGVPHGLTTRNPEAAPAFEALRELQQVVDTWYIDYADATPADRADEQVHFKFIGGGAGVMTRGEIITHVVNHATYHRGHVSGVLYQLGSAVPTTDLPVFLCEARQ
jgi:uncharacterized damage-inducible protein DinB